MSEFSKKTNSKYKRTKKEKLKEDKLRRNFFEKESKINATHEKKEIPTSIILWVFF